MGEYIKLKKSDIKFFLDKTYPEYNGRSFYAKVAEKYTMKNYWTDGTKYETMGIRVDGSAFTPHPDTTNPFLDVAHTEFKIPDDVMVVEHVIFCGKDCGLRFIVSPNSVFMPKMLKGA